MKKNKFIAIGLCFVLSLVLIGTVSKYESNASAKNISGSLKVFNTNDSIWKYEVTNSNFKNTVEFIEAALSGAELTNEKEEDELTQYSYYKKVKIGNSSHIVSTKEFKGDEALNELANKANLTEESLIGKDPTSPYKLVYSAGSDKISLKFSNYNTFLFFRLFVYQGSDTLRLSADKEYVLGDKTLTKKGQLLVIGEDERIDKVTKDLKEIGVSYPISYTIEKDTNLSLDNVTLKTGHSNLYTGGTKNITAKAELNVPEALKPYIKSTTYNSSNDSVATVENGVITAKKKGTAKINVTLTTNGGAQKTFTQTVSVKNASISFAKKTVKVKKGKKKTVSVKLKGHDPSKVKWSSSNKKIAKIVKTTKTGKVIVKGRKKGTAKITAKIKVNGKKTVKKTFTVKVG